MTTHSSVHDMPSHIGFGEYSQHVPTNIPIAVQQATSRFLGLRATRITELPNWEQLRDSAHAIRLHTLENLDYYLEKLEQQVEKAGGKVHWAVDSAQAREIVLQIAKEHQVKSVVKVKSMATEEIGLNHALQAEGIAAYETDLGEFIIQLAGTGPSHIIIPAVHLKKEEIAQLFRDKLGVDAPAEPIKLAGIAREFLREKFLKADMGISGANFIVAETGTLVIVTNEGNGRMCTTLPDLHVAVVGIDKVIPDWESLSVLLQLLARSATGQKLSAYTSFITGPSHSDHEGGPKEFHLVIIDNGRSRILADPVARETLKCIRCGCCLNICPVYKNVGGYAYGWFISGPIGAIFSTQILGGEAAKELPFASSLCGACADVCPVKIPIPKILLHLRHRVVEGDQFEHATSPRLINAGVKIGGLVLNQNWLYRFGTRVLPTLQVPLKKNGWIPALPAPLNRWTKVRPLPAFRGGFRHWWHQHMNRLDRKPR